MANARNVIKNLTAPFSGLPKTTVVQSNHDDGHEHSTGKFLLVMLIASCAMLLATEVVMVLLAHGRQRDARLSMHAVTSSY